MRILSRVGFASTVIALALVLAPQVHANHVSEVLGDSVDESEVEFPGIAAGPGFILPDSALYPLDQLAQEIRLLLAFTPEQEAIVHMRIAGEGMAETKVMMSRKNKAGIQTALSRVEREVASAAQSLSDAAAKGRGNVALARSMNDTLGSYRSVLATVASQAPGSLALKLASVRQSMLEAKVRVEDQLPGDELAIATDTDLADEVDTQVLGVKTTADKLAMQYNTLENRSNLSSDQKMKYEEMMASKSGMKKELLEQRKKMLLENQEQRKKLQDERKKILDQIKVLMQSLQNNQKATQQLKQAQNSLNVFPTGTPTQ